MPDGADESIAHLVPQNARRLNGLIARLPLEQLRDIEARVAARAFAAGAWTEVEGAQRAVPLTLRPRLVDVACRGYVHHVVWQTRMGLRRLIKLIAAHPEAAALLPLDAGERDWVERYARRGDGPGERLFCRLDALVRFDGPGWRSTLQLMEANVAGVGGMSYAPAVEQAVLAELVPALESLDDELTLSANPDPRALLLDELCAHAEDLGVVGPPRIALVDDVSLTTLGGEMARLAAWLRGEGHDAVYVDPRALELAADGAVLAEGRPVDVVYRYLELRDLAEMEAQGADLRALRAAFAAGRVVPSVGGDLEHKSAFEILTSPAFAAAFTDEQRAVFREHIPWTRLVRARRTPGPDERPVDLERYLRAHRATLVLKPNRASGGEGVLIGEATDAATWEATVDRAFTAPDTWVVQRLSPPDRGEYPVVEPDGLRFTPLYAAAGFFPGRNGLGVFGRYAAERVVNIHAGGGLLPYLVSLS